MASGSFLLSGEYAAAINAMPLFVWIGEVPFGISWWLWLTLVLLTLLSLNTVCCSSETLWSRRGAGQLYVLLAPQLIHAGFLFIVLAHLLSAMGSSLSQVEVQEGSLVTLPNGRQFGVADISVSITPQGMPIGFSSRLATDLQNIT
ncbi:MAG: cytochrome C biogenesis protein ResB, partial [Deltaproteobacteria bacterium]|nr:cytochrome C biogenesis protein ResB [Deltaproteobacteria bacterium]